jgi:hypothetical protein
VLDWPESCARGGGDSGESRASYLPVQAALLQASAVVACTTASVHRYCCGTIPTAHSLPPTPWSLASCGNHAHPSIQVLLAKVRYNKTYGTRRVASAQEVDDGSTDVEVPVASSGTAASVGAPLHHHLRDNAAVCAQWPFPIVVLCARHPCSVLGH